MRCLAEEGGEAGVDGKHKGVIEVFQLDFRRWRLRISCGPHNYIYAFPGLFLYVLRSIDLGLLYV
jgi:hypothetical protein